jgi:D-3-phosphoglycerate dehydrogenase / 2-oxoglutarate reductase
MLYVTNSDKPGFIGKVGALMGEVGINIARLNLGRDKPGGDAIALIAIDSKAGDDVIARMKNFEHVNRVQRLEF